VTTILLVRHATCDPVGRSLAGRAPGVLLNAEGRAQAARLAELLRAAPITAVYSSPLERAAETAAAIALPRAQRVIVDDRLTELDFGDWTGQSLDALQPDESWRHFNGFRSGTRPPAGELMLEAQARAVDALLAARESHGDESVAMVSHGDVIRAVLAYFLAIPLDLASRLEITPASVSVLELHAWGPRVLRVNSIVGDPWNA
jgi:probable phosphomutase (TIGR03848 family)